ncbi:hypothetical protein D0Y65_038467 [Glycine soja]|uniref:FAD-binding domain-containing protein n=1 Tax=Glycine soja TaxID=3848 RepID=A0A445H563_GLYSO|nr:hypothetical protein D0Y65_038467 [Glycine soja]
MSPCFLAAGSPEAMFFLGGIVSCQMRIIFDSADCIFAFGTKTFQGTSVTMKVSSDMIQKMHQEAEKVWTPELFKVLKETKKPFLNVIYDGEPLGETFWDNVVLVGDVAHPTTPHCLRSTNMSILDVAVLGKCLEKFGAEKLRLALEEYQFIRLPVTSKQVLHAR